MPLFTEDAVYPVPPPRLIGGAARHQDPQDRIRARVVSGHTACWEWVGRIEPGGYGTLGSRFAHRASYEAFVEPIPRGYEVDHECLNRRCVKPSHLRAVTKAVNNWLAWQRRDRSRCKRGHLIAECGRTNGGACRACNRERQHRSQS